MEARMRKFEIEIVTPEGLAFSGEAESITLRADTGNVQIMAGHTDYIATLDTGKLVIRADGEDRIASSSGGFVSVKGGKVKVVVISLGFADQIDVERAENAKIKAEERLRNAKTDAEIEIAKAKLKRAISRINVSKLK